MDLDNLLSCTDCFGTIDSIISKWEFKKKNIENIQDKKLLIVT